MAIYLTGTEIDSALKIINTTELQNIFLEMENSMQVKVLNKAFKQASESILNVAKSNFNSIKKGESSTGYTTLSKGFKTRSTKNELGMVFGLQESGLFKYRWINYGTKERFTKGKNPRSTGVIQPTLFFTRAVDSTIDKAQSNISDGIIKVLQDIIKK